VYIQLWHWHDVSPRAYNSPGRIVAATKTRQRIVAAAAAILGTAEGISGFSLQAVADKAGVTRLTVYNQFGSRRALLEGVFDDMAIRGGLHRIPGVMAGSDPQAGLRQVIAIFCDFWSFGCDALGPLHAAGASDPEFGASVRERNERRRRLLSVLVRRMAKDRKLRPKALGDLIDVLFALTSFPFFSQLTAQGRSAEAACSLIQGLATDAVWRSMKEEIPVGAD
jgi:AcrR family transcriptional regulator